jgi:predicted nucleotidyltransferase/GNAT superfamily N-acetyltransferase
MYFPLCILISDISLRNIIPSNAQQKNHHLGYSKDTRMRFIKLPWSMYASTIIIFPIVNTACTASELHSMNKEASKCASVRIVQVSNEKEWEAARRFRHVYFFGPAGIQDPYNDTLTHPSHRHFVLYQGTEIVGYAHVQFWPEQRVIIRIMAVDEHMRNQGLGQCLMQLLEAWLVEHGHCTICLDSRPTAVRFYEKCGFEPAAFKDHEGYESHTQDTQMQKQIGNSTTQLQQQLKKSIELLQTILDHDLLAIYLYGSALVGGLQKYSDVDLFVVTHRATTTEEKTQLIHRLLQISGLYMKGAKFPLEITIVEKTAVNPWLYTLLTLIFNMVNGSVHHSKTVSLIRG